MALAKVMFLTDAAALPGLQHRGLDPVRRQRTLDEVESNPPKMTALDSAATWAALSVPLS
jgi:hypothetical protein